MKKNLIFCAIFLVITGLVSSAFAYEAMVGPTGVLKYDKGKSYGGYTLFSPTVACKTTYLIDVEGNIVHTWESEYTAGLYSQLLPNGNLMRGGKIKQEPGFCKIGGASGIVQELDWDGNVVWEYKLFTPGKELHHHAFHRMPNGNTLILAWEGISKKDVLAKGRDPKTVPEQVIQGKIVHKDFWIDFIREVDKSGKTAWEWHAFDHIGKGPKKLDINYKLPDPVGHTYPNFDWTHCNTVGYIPDTDQVILNSRNFSEFFLINHKSGEIEFRWGNPSTHGAGKRPGWYDNGDQKVFGSHHANLLDNGNILVFDNGSERAEGNRSSVVEVNINTGEIVWQYTSKNTSNFFSFRQGACQRLPNGNTFITSTDEGHLFEVTKDKEVVWDFVNPISFGKAKCSLHDKDDAISGLGHDFTGNMIHRAYRYGKDYPGLQGKDLSIKGQLAEGCPQFFKVWKKGSALTGAEEEEEGPETMKKY